MKQVHSHLFTLRQTADTQRRKRLGQYFTGTGLGRLLAALAKADKARTIIDPMVGTGDLLASCLEIGAKPELMAGVEIDPLARDAFQSRLPLASCLLGSAFDLEVISRLPTQAWDLVIANPPYVRYQSFSDKADGAQALPSAVQIRTALLQSIPALSALDEEDKRLFASLVSCYSGLADLAVPSWILCSGMVKQGGRLALVVPEAWLSRDYATIVHYLLLRWFDIEFVVEDEHASWFDDAQVKTTLIVAKRVKRHPAGLTRAEDASYCRIAISAEAASSESPIGNLGLSGAEVEKSFAKQARLWLRNGATNANRLTRAQTVSLTRACTNVIAAASRQKWFALVGEDEIAESQSVCVPQEIHDWLLKHGLPSAFNTFESQGIAVGQGLRTGANSFFYADGYRDGTDVKLTFSGPLFGRSAKVPSSIAKSAVRRQSDLPNRFAVSSATANGYALDLRGYALPEDMEASDFFGAAYMAMPNDLAEVVRAAARANFGTLEKPQKVYELTAVAPNVRSASRASPARHWYMLPDFAPRHLPDVFLARVNAVTPKAYLNLGRECLIDANFSTMWTRATSKWTANALLAFMNSAWAQAVIERSGAVMGGGALKVEATHLRRLPVPTLNEEQLRGLDRLGAMLVMEQGLAEAMAAIDAILAAALGCDDGGNTELRRIACSGQACRAKHSKRRGSRYGDEVC